MAPRIVLITNPCSGSSSRGKVEKAIRILESRGRHVDLLHTCAPGHATELAERALQEMPDLIIAAGGDGTINEVFNGMAMSTVPLAILPLGTANVLAREAGIPLDITGAAEAAVGRPSHRIALGHITFGPTSRYFALMAGFGFDALSVHNLSPSLKRRTGKLAYIVSGFQTLASWKAIPITLRADGREIICSNAIVSNGRKYGGDFVVAPHADIASPVLNITVLKGMKRRDILKLSLGILTGRHTTMRGVEHFTASRVELSAPVHVQLDGDHAGTAPATISIVPDALSLVY